MKTQMKKGIIMLLPIGLLCVSLALMLDHFGIIGDTMSGFLTGFGVGLEILVLVKAKKFQRCDSQLT